MSDEGEAAGMVKARSLTPASPCSSPGGASKGLSTNDGSVVASASVSSSRASVQSDAEEDKDREKEGNVSSPSPELRGDATNKPIEAIIVPDDVEQEKDEEKHNKYCHFCQHVKLRAASMLPCENKGCARRFCEHCLQTQIGDDMNKETSKSWKDGLWHCPVCRRICCCALKDCKDSHRHCKAYRYRRRRAEVAAKRQTAKGSVPNVGIQGFMPGYHFPPGNFGMVMGGVPPQQMHFVPPGVGMGVPRYGGAGMGQMGEMMMDRMGAGSMSHHAMMGMRNAEQGFGQGGTAYPQQVDQQQQGLSMRYRDVPAHFEQRGRQMVPAPDLLNASGAHMQQQQQGYSMSRGMDVADNSRMMGQGQLQEGMAAPGTNQYLASGSFSSSHGNIPSGPTMRSPAQGMMPQMSPSASDMEQSSGMTRGDMYNGAVPRHMRMPSPSRSTSGTLQEDDGGYSMTPGHQISPSYKAYSPVPPDMSLVRLDSFPKPGVETQATGRMYSERQMPQYESNISMPVQQQHMHQQQPVNQMPEGSDERSMQASMQHKSERSIMQAHAKKLQELQEARMQERQQMQMEMQIQMHMMQHEQQQQQQQQRQRQPSQQEQQQGRQLLPENQQIFKTFNDLQKIRQQQSELAGQAQSSHSQYQYQRRSASAVNQRERGVSDPVGELAAPGDKHLTLNDLGGSYGNQSPMRTHSGRGNASPKAYDRRLQTLREQAVFSGGGGGGLNKRMERSDSHELLNIVSTNRISQVSHAELVKGRRYGDSSDNLRLMTSGMSPASSYHEMSGFGSSNSLRGGDSSQGNLAPHGSGMSLGVHDDAGNILIGDQQMGSHRSLTSMNLNGSSRSLVSIHGHSPVIPTGSEHGHMISRVSSDGSLNSEGGVGFGVLAQEEPKLIRPSASFLSFPGTESINDVLQSMSRDGSTQDFLSFGFDP